MKKKALAILLALAMTIAFVVPAMAAAKTTDVFLKGSGSGKDTFEGWSNAFYMEGIDADAIEKGAEYQVWHLVYSGDLVKVENNKGTKTTVDSGEVSEMQLDFGDNGIWTWNKAEDGYSFNAGGNNAGWIVYAPLDWELTSGNFVHDSFLTTINAKAQFNISGYGRFENPYLEIVKKWANEDGDIVWTGPIGPDGETEAIFDVYDEDGEEYLTGWNGSKTKVDPGTYTIVEQAKAGYVVQLPKTITVGMNYVTPVVFTNVPDVPELYTVFSIEKTVDGNLLGDWAADGDIDLEELVSGMSFSVFAAILDENGEPVSYDDSEAIGFGLLGIFGSIEFDIEDVVLDGWYAVVEEFVPDSLAEALFDVVEPLYVYFNNGEIIGGIGADFDYSALYTIVNGYNQRGDWGYPDGIGYPNLNDSGDIFYIGVTNTATKEEYPSFCAHAGSDHFAGDAGLGCNGYVCALSGREIEAINFDDFLSALNFIEDKYGPVAEQRVITQVVTWALLGAIDIDSNAFANTKLTSEQKNAVIDVINNSKGYDGEGKIVDVAYLICDVHGITETGFAHCQPQLVPIYGDKVKIVFDNKTKAELYSSIEIKVDFDAIEEYIEQTHKDAYRTGEYGQSKTTWIGDIGNDDYIMDKSEEIIFRVYVADLLDGGKTYHFADRDGNNGKLPYTYTVTLSDAGEVIITVDNNVIRAGNSDGGSFAVKAWTAMPEDFGNNSTNQDYWVIKGKSMRASSGPQNSKEGLFYVTEDMEYFYLEVHTAALSFYELDDNGDWIPYCVLDGNSAVQTRPYSGDDDVLVQVSINGSELYEFNSLEYLDALTAFNAELAGDTEVTVDLYLNGVLVNTVTITTVKGECSSFVFENIIFNVNEGDPIRDVLCEKDYCPGWIA